MGRSESNHTLSSYTWSNWEPAAGLARVDLAAYHTKKTAELQPKVRRRNEGEKQMVKLRLAIPSSTSSRRHAEETESAQFRDETSESSDESEDGSDTDNSEYDTTATKKSSLQVPDSDEEIDNGLVHNSLAAGLSDAGSLPPLSLFVPGDYHLGQTSRLKTKAFVGRGATVMRPVNGNIFTKRLNPVVADEQSQEGEEFSQPRLSFAGTSSKRRATFIPDLAKRPKPPIQHVNVRLLPNAKANADDEDEGTYQDLHRRGDPTHSYSILKNAEPFQLSRPDPINNMLEARQTIVANAEYEPHIRSTDVFMVDATRYYSSSPREVEEMVLPTNFPPRSPTLSSHLDDSSDPALGVFVGHTEDLDSDDDEDMQDQVPVVESQTREEPSEAQDIPWALQSLQFDKKDRVFAWLLKNISASTLHFSEGQSEKEKAEISQLRFGLQQIIKYKDINAKLEEEKLPRSEIAFVHAGSLEILIRRTSQIRREINPVFMVYGMDSTGRKWKPEEIFPFGGIVTLTVDAIASNLEGVVQKMRRISDRPLWEAFTLPPVVGLAMKKRFGKDLESVKNDLVFEAFIELIEEGTISLVEDPAAHWNERKADFGFCSHEEIIAECAQAASGRKISLEAHIEESNEDVVHSMQEMFTRHEIITRYRRFAVLTGEEEKMSSSLGVAKLRCTLNLPPMDAVDNFILDPAFHDYLAILKGARNGFVYGVKVRFPHALVMSILVILQVYPGSELELITPFVMSRLKVIYRATKQHAFNLAKFVSLYKALLLLQKRVNGGKERSADTFIAGLLGGYLVFGERTAVNEQIVLYVMARVVASFLPRTGSYSASPQSPRASATVKPIPPHPKYFAVLAAVAWGAVMWLFKERGETIQPGMFNSMTYLYRDSESWKNLKTLLWHNA
ncbi:hypothetical protein D9757_006290 [Collybiopsis confluens]|uniref:Uncharacterized protein n=1 Tax=Collybiopsis confluens TaxID=2823264 RepID=A0A8H5HG31_9AGAR|nr:hypothetical protein D9757_006290 [Collybiopsis confluens]